MKKKQSHRQTIDSIEAIKDIPNEVKKTVTEAGKGVVTDLWEQILGSNEKPQPTQKSGDLKQGEELVLQRAEPAIDYARELIQAEKFVAKKQQSEVKVQIQELLVELKKITKTSKELEVEFKDIAVEVMPVNPGKFHLNFFEWVLAQVRRARMRIEDSAHWVKTIRSKKSQRQYWSLFKKHGTSFGLSGERIVATQTG